MNTVCRVAAQISEQLVLDHARVSASSAPKGSSSSSIFGWIAKAARYSHALLHAAGELGRLLVLGARSGRPCR